MRLDRLASQDAAVVVERAEQRGRDEERRDRGQKHRDGRERRPRQPVAEEVCACDRDADEGTSVEVRPDRDERHDEPDGVRRRARLAAEEIDEDRKEGKREELAADDEHRRGGRDGDEEQDESGRSVGHVLPPHVEREEAERSHDGYEEADHEPTVARECLEPVKHELPEHGHVLPAGRGSGGVRDTRRNLPEPHDHAAECR